MAPYEGRFFITVETLIHITHDVNTHCLPLSSKIKNQKSVKPPLATGAETRE
jgi:hypothetical protein